MDLGFETIGNATLICHDRGPVLVTDPWIEGAAYFGSWTFSHEIPEEQRAAIDGARMVWVSHGHPDHLSLRSLRKLREKKILLPDHVGGRIAHFLKSDGFDVSILRDGVWHPVSERVKIMSIADSNQDGILLADVGGRLVVNLNDASDHGWRSRVRRVVRSYPWSILLRISGVSDVDMINLFDEDGKRIPPRKTPQVGRMITRMMQEIGTSAFAPFSSMHEYQRSDSVWANEFGTRLEDYSVGFNPRVGDLLPAFLRYDCTSDDIQGIRPTPRTPALRDPKDFGDDWSDELEADDVRAITRYFKSFQHLDSYFDFVGFRVGGRDKVVSLNSQQSHRGITFETPRTSLMFAIEHEIFDDLLIGNFMRTTLHGGAELHPHFTPYVAKYGDNGSARSREELHRYFREYRHRAPIDYLRYRVQWRAHHALRSLVARNATVHGLARKVYRRWRGL